VPSVHTSVGIARATTCANRSSASAYGDMDPDTSISSTTLRGRVPLRRYRGLAGSPPFASIARSVRLGSSRPLRAFLALIARLFGGTGLRVAINSRRCAFSAGVSPAMSLSRRTSASPAAVASLPAPPCSAAPPLSEANWVARSFRC
jgi:hypothetical protein